MSQELINRSPDLRKLCDEGYEISIKDTYIVVESIPYVNKEREIKKGTLVSSFELKGDKVSKPADHVINFSGDRPCHKDGSTIREIYHQSEEKCLGGITVNHSFSSKPQGGYSDYYHKFTTYIKSIEHPARSIDPFVTAKTYKGVESVSPESPFLYPDTNSSRAEISDITKKFDNMKVAIIGLGGTGSYVLDFVAKTPVKEIHLFDEDGLLNNNAFRIPGAVSLETLKTKPKKVSYLERIYSKMRRGIVLHDYNVKNGVLNEIETLRLNFVFLCIDDGEAKKKIIAKLVELSIPCIDTGIGMNKVDGRITGSARITTVTKDKKDHVKDFIPFSKGEEGPYNRNIQIAEINAINAALAVIKWKKFLGFYPDYPDSEKEYHSVYEIYTNKMINEKCKQDDK